MASAPTTFSMASPGSTPYWTITDRSGTKWTADGNGVISNVTLSALVSFIDAGCSLLALDGPGIPGFSSNAATSAATLSVAALAGGDPSIIAMTGALGAGAVLTLPTVALLAAGAAGAVAQGSAWVLRILNQSSGAFAWTLTTAAGWTLTGNMAINQNTWAEFLVTIAAGGAAGVVQRIGSGVSP